MSLNPYANPNPTSNRPYESFPQPQSLRGSNKPHGSPPKIPFTIPGGGGSVQPSPTPSGMQSMQSMQSTVQSQADPQGDQSNQTMQVMMMLVQSQSMMLQNQQAEIRGESLRGLLNSTNDRDA